MRDSQFKLTPTLPGPLFGRSVYNELRNTKRRKEWEALRRSILEAASNTCARCSASYESRMVCNEVWAYDDQKYIATLTALEIVCRDCDSVLHYGKTLLIAEQKGIDRDEQAVSHMMKVNGISGDEARDMILDAMAQWMMRSKRKTWAIQIAPELIEKHPILVGLKL